MGFQRLRVYFDVILDILGERLELLDRIVGVGGPVSRGRA
jgi:hypothetical protein